MIEKIILITLILACIFTKNKPMVLASIIVLIFSFINNDNIIKFSRKYFLETGLCFLMIWMLIPLIDKNKESILDVKNYLNLNGFVSIACGIFVAIIASKGLNFLTGNVSVLGGVILGSIIGVAFLGGIPVGPMIASGISFEIIAMIKYFVEK
ncbi:hypothetical protein CLOACE_22290 [Clostridium acetireducens DSM 10703]|uniref:UPF0756 membrane protein CLOACE_22290 n=1 Tax=Clostridium acetireducens DSM 10703 TaxID=1121290 RepID=A0A1E8EVC9_9CLOT|nr:DUF441 family protein [Clostridium acetireducens]OFH99477.1 hypothetical protein CLOACE_22290 [Clostridium acetireducens DSM 10703]